MFLSKQEKTFIKSLHQSETRILRSEYSAEGSRLVLDLISSAPSDIIKIYATTGWLNKHSSKIENIAHLVSEISESDLASIAQLRTTKEVLGIFKFPTFNSNNSTSNQNTVVFLDRISDPGNLGTIIRTCDWFGISSIYCAPGSVHFSNSKVVQSSMSSIARVQVKYLAIAQVKQLFEGHKFVGATLHGLAYNEIDKPEQIVILIGNEANGLSQEAIDLCDIFVSIPAKLSLGAESLNAAVAAAILISSFSK